MSEKRVFISYAQNDQPFAQYLAKELQRRGFKTWFWSSDAKLKLSAEWENEMNKALKAANLFVPLVSDQYIKSEFALVELGGAYGLHKNIVPVLLSSNLQKLPFILRQFKPVDAMKMDMESLVRSIENAAVMPVA